MRLALIAIKIYPDAVMARSEFLKIFQDLFNFCKIRSRVVDLFTSSLGIFIGGE